MNKSFNVLAPGILDDNVQQIKAFFALDNIVSQYCFQLNLVVRNILQEISPQIYMVRVDHFEDVLLIEFIYLVFARMPGECYHKQFNSFLLCQHVTSSQC